MVYGGALASGALTHQLEIFGWETTGLGALPRRRRRRRARLPARGGRRLVARSPRRAPVPRAARTAGPSEPGADRACRALVRPLGVLGRAARALTPIARSFVSIPAGLFESPFGRYNLLTLIGNGIWCLFFAAIGWALGASWDTFDHGFRFVDVAVVVIVVLAVAALLLRRLRRGGRHTMQPVVKIPHVDVAAQYAPLRAELEAAFAKTLDTGQLHLRPRGRGVRARGGGAARRRRVRQLRERHRRARAGARRARGRRRRRGGLPGVHVLRDGRGDRAAGRHAGLRRHRPRHAQPRPGRRRAS